MNNRDSSIDFLKGFAMLFVLIGHISAAMISSNLFINSNNILNAVYLLIYLFHMTIFYIISGYVEKYSKNNDLKKVFKKSFISLVIPYLIFSYLLLCINLFLHNPDFSLFNFISILYKPISNLWFIYALFFMKIIEKILYKTINNNYIISLIWILMCFGSLFISFDFVVLDIMRFGVAYHFGYMFGKTKISYTIKTTIVCLVALIIGGFIYFNYSDLIGKNIFGISLFIVLYYIVSKKQINNKFISFIGINTLVFLVIDGFTNAPLVNITYNILNIHNALLCFIVCVLSKIIISSIISWLCSKTKLIKMWFYPSCIIN